MASLTRVARRDGRVVGIVVWLGMVWLVGVADTARADELDVLISEVHYNVFRSAADEDLEFVEIHNRGPTAVDVGGWHFTEGIDYTFPAGTQLAPGAYAVVGAHPAAAERAYGLDHVWGPFMGRLDNGGEVLALANGAGHVVNRIHFDDDNPWPSRPDGRGPSLEFTGRDDVNDRGQRWKPSLYLHGTPGAPNSRRVAMGQLWPEPSPYVGGIINEVSSPDGGNPGFLELYNPLAEPLDLSGHVIYSSGADFFFEVPDATELSPGELVWFSGATMDLPIPTAERRYVLVEDDGRTILDDLQVSPVVGRSFGRFPDGDDDSHVLDGATPGEPNEYTEERTVVINEIAYHPPFVAPNGDCVRRCSDRLQWIELHNPGNEAVDLTAWRLTGAVRFTFGEVSIAAGGYLVAVADAVAFAAEYPAVADFVGDWSGRLSHASERIVLRNELGNPVDRVEYGDGRPMNDEEPADGIDDRTFRGSFWPHSPDGGGPTLELIHPTLSNRAAVAWRASSDDGGTPGRRNSRYDAQPAPTVRDVEHDPAVPNSSQDVRVTCRISSVAPLTRTIVRWSVDGGGANGTVDLVDDGTGSDRVAGDGEFTARIPERSDGDVVRFRIEAEDADGESLRVPLEPAVDPYGGYPGTYYLYEVDDDDPPATGAPVYRIVMTADDTRELGDRPEQSDVLLPATFIADDRVFYLVGVRYRGENSRREDNRSYKVRLHPEQPFDGIDNLNLNGGNGGTYGTDSYQELVAADVFRRVELPYGVDWPVILHFPGEVDRDFDTRYIRKEAFDDDFLARYFGGSDHGSLYRARNPIPGGPGGELEYRGEDADDYRDLYEKRSNEEEDDFSDIIELCRAFERSETPAEEFPAAMQALVDVRQWARFFAVTACLSNGDGGIWNRTGEDYFLYRVPEDSARPDAGKWLLLAWDIEETFQDADERFFRSDVVSIERFFSVPEHSRLYYEELRRARDGAFSRLQMRQRYGAADLMFEPRDVYNVVDRIDTNVTMRLGFIDSDVSWSLDAGAIGTDEQEGELVIEPGDTWRYFRGTEQPLGDAEDWTQRVYDDSGWESGPSGFGYGDGDDATVLADMEDEYTTVFVRREFDVDEAATVVGMTLICDYDDAYVAYINGVEVARTDLAPGGVIEFDSTAGGSREAGDDEERNLVDFVDLLQTGTNVLAIVGINREADSSDFSLIPSLSISTGGDGGGPAGGCGGELWAQGAIVRLDGVCDPVTVRSVSAAGTTVDTSMIIGGNGPWGAVWSTEIRIDGGANLVTIRGHSEPGGAGDVVASVDVVIHRAPGGFRNVRGTISDDETWTAEEGPYRLTGDVTVSGSGSLTIEPGAIVLASENASIIVRGELRALGSADDPVRMLAYRCGENWGGIAFDDTGRGGSDPTHELSHVVIRDGSSEGGYDGCVAPVGSKLLVSDCELSRIPDNAIDATSSVLEVRDSHIHDIFEGIHCTSSTTYVSDTTIENMMGNSDAIDFDGSGPERSVIERCLLRNSSDDGIDLGGVTVDIRDNVIIGIEDKAVSMEGPGSQGDPTLTGNIVAASGVGVAIKDGIDVTEGWHNTVANCQQGVQFYAKDFAPDGGHGTLHSLIVWDNVLNVSVDGRSSATIEYSNIGGEELWPGAGNLRTDPRFVDAPAGNYALRFGSPCIGTGFDGEDMGAVPFELGSGVFVRGDADGSGTVELTDVIVGLSFLFRGGAGPEQCRDMLDSNDDGTADVSDAIYTLRWLYAGGPIIPPPFPNVGEDPTEDEHTCGP